MKVSLHKLAYFLTIAMILPVLIIFTACSTGNATTSSTVSSSSTATGNNINIANFAFSPATLTINAGTKVTWTNNDGMTHTVTSDNGVFNSGNLSPNATFSYTFNSTGTFTYHCAIHTYMTGTVIVH